MTNLTDERIENIAKLTGVGTQTVREWVYGDWDNQDEHDQWLATATDEEIADWIETSSVYMNEKRYEILELTNNETWADIVEWMGQWNEAEIRTELARVFGDDGERTSKLASDIRYELDRGRYNHDR